MQRLTCATTGQPITLITPIARSGEGEIWQTDQPGKLAKIYHSVDQHRVRKLEVMVANPPKDPNAGMNHISFAWAESLLEDENGLSVGFLMPEITNSVQLLEVYNPSRRQKVLPGFNWLYLHTTAMNIASIIGAIHQAGYVVGDIKPENILVNDRALPAIIDTDSFQVRDPDTGELFHCRVGSEGFTPVELLSKDLSVTPQTVVHDRFRLGVIIHLLLFGDYPFKGKWMGAGDSPAPVELLRQGYWSYAPKSLIQPGPLTIPLETVHPAVQSCFLRCFNDGHRNPELRPTPAEWMSALSAARSEIVVCKKNKNHYYSKTYDKCYWCQRKATLGVDIFPSVIPPSQNPTIRALQGIQSKLVKQTKQTIQQVSPRLQQTIATLKSIGMPIQLIPNLQFNQPLKVATSPVQPATLPGKDPIIWKRLGIAIAVLTTLFALLLFLSRSKVDAQEMELTSVGIFLCLGLVAIGFLWLRVLDRLNS